MAGGPGPRGEQIRGDHQEHGPDAVAFYISGQPLTEDYYVFNEETLSSRVYQ